MQIRASIDVEWEVAKHDHDSQTERPDKQTDVWSVIFKTLYFNSLNVWIKRTGSGSLAAPTRSVTLNCVPCHLWMASAAQEVAWSAQLMHFWDVASKRHLCIWLRRAERDDGQGRDHYHISNEPWQNMSGCLVRSFWIHNVRSHATMSDNSGGGRELACYNVRLLSEILTCLRFLLKMRSVQVKQDRQKSICLRLLVHMLLFILFLHLNNVF